MTIRPTAAWRAEAARHADSGTPYTPQLLAATDSVLGAYEAEAADLGGTASDEAVLAAVRRVVLALNDIDAEHGTYCTIEREDLCEYIDTVLSERGVDVVALAARHGMDGDDIAGEWRDW
ncbi:hypothetical protein [Streptomyces pristinaespiralis]|jgi:hypothetical protein|uniref:hypothetical protein n=1 Tax=Streptomyces pristinaespiralis TaxID=38300 RepID=UPI00383340EE